ncbi:DUF4148 domain-containing protein [Herbaspirillum camelliae]|uniref:DUF4148 domain-containing protein n=1 Tax=Herbaspirillum camelliae TaxID=1892903 RepID=UPI000949F3BA|nr:DUF4148 domain-containing protein [Herbaspirillum camelliae]
MNTKHLFAALLLSTTVGAAMAEAPYPVESKFVSTKTRADVIAELQQARSQGQLLVTDRDQGLNGADTRAVAQNGKTREQVRAELAQARANGEMKVTDQ